MNAVASELSTILAARAKARFDGRESAQFAGESLVSWRQVTREELGLPLDRPIIMTGHQAGIWHAGIAEKFVAGGAMMIVHRGETVVREAFGFADLATGRPFTVDAPCRLASVTKPFTATLFARLVEEGRLAWDDPVDKFLPEFAALEVRGQGRAKRAPLIRELLSHTAGFPGNDERRAGAVDIARHQHIAGKAEKSIPGKQEAEIRRAELQLLLEIRREIGEQHKLPCGKQDGHRHAQHQRWRAQRLAPGRA